MSFIVVIGIFAALWVYRDAQKFGHSKTMALLWALGNVPAVWIFLPLYLMLGRRVQIKRRIEEKTIDADAIFVGETVACPMCAGQVQEDFNLCPYCGYTLHLICENCGQELQREWNVCPHCQTKTPEK